MEYRTENELAVSYKKHQPAAIRGERVRRVARHNPDVASPGQVLMVDIPRLMADECLVPGSFTIRFEFDQSNDKATHVQNLVKALIDRLRIRCQVELFDCQHFNVYEVYRDLWLPVSERAQLTEQGISSANLRTLRTTKYATGTKTAGSDDVTLYNVYGNEYNMHLSHILGDHGLFAHSRLNGTWRYEVTLAPAASVMTTSDDSAVSYQLKNIRYEYEILKNQGYADAVESEYGGQKTLSYLDVHHSIQDQVAAAATVLNINISDARASLKTILIFFTELNRTDPEEYVYPNIDEVELQIKGRTQLLYSEGIPKNRFYDEAKRWFMHRPKLDETMNVSDFYRDKFCLVLDLRSNPNMGTNHGQRIIDNPNSVNIHIKKRATTNALRYDVFLCADAMGQFAGGNGKRKDIV